MSDRHAAAEVVHRPGREACSPHFVADAMVGKLARWLRVLGLDVTYDPALGDRELLALARRENRVLLTRDAPLVRRANGPPTLFIESEDYREQLQQVVTTYGLDPWRHLFSRCVECNHPLESASREDVRERVPLYVYFTQAEFKRCPRCSKVLWGGTHRDRMVEMLETLFEPPGRE